MLPLAALLALATNLGSIPSEASERERHGRRRARAWTSDQSRAFWHRVEKRRKAKKLAKRHR